jgi:hypothetical protein
MRQHQLRDGSVLHSGPVYDMFEPVAWRVIASDGQQELLQPVGQLELRGLKVHSGQMCVGPTCALHAPSNHHMITWPLRWDTEEFIFRRECPHGIGHPDPDELAWRHRFDRPLAPGVVEYGCDGCCRPHTALEAP